MGPGHPRCPCVARSATTVFPSRLRPGCRRLRAGLFPTRCLARRDRSVSIDAHSIDVSLWRSHRCPFRSEYAGHPDRDGRNGGPAAISGERHRSRPQQSDAGDLDRRRAPTVQGTRVRTTDLHGPTCRRRPRQRLLTRVDQLDRRRARRTHIHVRDGHREMSRRQHGVGGPGGGGRRGRSRRPRTRGASHGRRPAPGDAVTTASRRSRARGRGSGKRARRGSGRNRSGDNRTGRRRGGARDKRGRSAARDVYGGSTWLPGTGNCGGR
jgi:hypothetical protein